MILFHRTKKSDEFSDKIEQRLDEMVISHKIHRYSDLEDKKLPCLQENDKMITGEKQIKEFLRELNSELREQRMISGDSCYIDPRTGKIC